MKLSCYEKHSDSVEGSIAPKLDMSKEYDIVEFFLERVMQRMWFNAMWIHRIMCCLLVLAVFLSFSR